MIRKNPSRPTPGALRTASLGPCSPSEAARIALQAWFTEAARDLPWRRPYSGSKRIPQLLRDPYATWISESMLQQTQVETVIRAFQAWMRRFPNLETLAKADEADVLSSWAGLGYYRRARNLLAAAKQIQASHPGRFPATRPGLLALPGVGEYTAGAILSLAFGQREALLDGNVMRVFSRYHGLNFSAETGEGRTVYWQTAKAWVDGEFPEKTNEALMELGALICKPRQPLCELCPLAATCHAKLHHAVESLPPAKAKAKTVMKAGIALVMRGGHKILLSRPEPGELLQDHFSLPILWDASTDMGALSRQVASAFPDLQIVDLMLVKKRVSHAITCHRIQLAVAVVQVGKSAKGEREKAGRRWVASADLPEALIHSLGRKIWKAAEKG